MISHTFAVCAYKDSPYLEECIRSLKGQSVQSEIILCTSTPSPFIQETASRYDLPLYVREGKSDIQEDWNFAVEKAAGRLVTIAHQDDCYHRDYGKYVQQCWNRYPDTSVFTTDCAIVKNGQMQKLGMVPFVKHVLRMPLRFYGLADRTWLKRLPFLFGNPVICPSCTYDREKTGEPVFDSPYKFALDWDTMWKLAGRPGRFICVERPLIRYRIHEEATTKACIVNHQRAADEAAMFGKIWPKPVVKLIMRFYGLAYRAYE